MTDMFDAELLCLRQSAGGSPQSQRPAELSDDEVGELFQRLAEVQQEKWMLEEKVRPADPCGRVDFVAVVGPDE